MAVYGSGGKFIVNTDNEVGPRLLLSDKEGYSSVLGKSDLVITKTGKTDQAPAASLVLFSKDNKVMWSAP